MLSRFYKENKTDKIWWADEVGSYGALYFSFDKKKVFCLFTDYPDQLTPEQKELFDKENPYWKNFFSGNPDPEYSDEEMGYEGE